MYAYFKQFIAQFIPNNLHTKSCGNKMALPYIKSTLSLIDLLLSYADREVFAHLRRRKVVIESYGTGWVTTVFSRTVDFTMIYELWEIFLFERDTYFLLYFAVGLIRFFRAEILKTTQFEKLITLMMSLRIRGLEELAEVYRHAVEVRQHTPVSFQMHCEWSGVFKFNPNQSLEELDNLENFGACDLLPLQAIELLRGSQHLADNSANNQKFQNLLVLSEDEKQIYLQPPCQEESKSNVVDSNQSA